ncbi:alpha/beta fold hydrolase [Agrobacterium vitis]|nr:alpha/beta fold hydrolase [Agrobacterium vitis]
MHEFHVPTGDDGISLYVRNKRRADLKDLSAANTVLFVHGSTYPASTSFDLPLGGESWMERLARSGYNVYLVDQRGYGLSSRPPEMDRPAFEIPPVNRTKSAVADMELVVKFILKLDDIPAINLIGWSWGTTVMSFFTSRHNSLVNKLVLLAPQWVRDTPSMSDTGGALGAYRLVSRADAKERWLNGVPPAKRHLVLPDDWFDLWADATFATDPWGKHQSPQMLRAPNGTVQDSREYWAAGQPIYNPGDIKVPVLIVHADLDRDLPLEMARTFFSLLVNARYRRWVEIGDGTHSAFMEKCRWQIFAAVEAFLAGK